MLSTTSTWHIHVLALLWLVAHLNGQVGWVSLHLLSLLLLLLYWWPLPFWTCFDTVPSPCMVGVSSPASQEGLGQLRGAAQLTTSQLSSAPLQSLVHHCMHHCTDCAGGQWQCQHKWQDDWQHCHCGLAGNCNKQQWRIPCTVARCPSKGMLLLKTRYTLCLLILGKIHYVMHYVYTYIRTEIWICIVYMYVRMLFRH